jgi:hypothetical protein
VSQVGGEHNTLGAHVVAQFDGNALHVLMARQYRG